MQLIDGRPVYAATDLVGYLACEHLTQLERAAMAGLTRRPMRADPELDIIRKRGFEHERRFLAGLRAEGRSVVEIALDGSIADQGEQLAAAARATVAAMAQGPDVIFQATFFDGTWRGHADFLLRVDSPDRPSRWGPFHYEVADTKLARHVKASAILQICSYVDQLTILQGVAPEWLHVALGGSTRAVERLRVDDYMAYYRTAKARFLALVGDPATVAFPPAATYPEPVDHCDVCRWAPECEARRRDDDHLAFVAGISSRQRRALGERGVTTLAGLGQLELPVVPRLEGTSAQALERVRDQARLQLDGRRTGRLLHELLLPPEGGAIEPGRGLAALPPPSTGDLFLDLEGDPYAFEDGLDYLFGVLETNGTFHAIWSRDERGEFGPDAERRAFERCVDLIVERRDADPTMHVYHYAPYEPTALKRLMGRYGTREAEVDRLLRAGVLVDLHRVVRQSLRASVESYSIKRLEPFYGFERAVDLRDAGSSIVAFEEWLELGEGERPAAGHLDRIEGYNRDDVVSTQRLRDWLEGLRAELAAATGLEVPRPAERVPELPPDLTETQARIEALVARLTDGVPTERGERSPEAHARWLLAQLLGWHRREDKSMWWEFFRLLDLTPEELVDEDGALGMLEPVGPLDEPARGRQTWRYRFPDQEYDLGRGEVYDPRGKQVGGDESPFSWKAGKVEAIDAVDLTVDLARPADPATPHPRALVPLDWIPSNQHQAALERLGTWVADHGIDAPGPYRAARDLLLGRPPRTGGEPGAPLARDGETDLSAARRLALELDETVLPIQGPPGSGKTYTGARMICTLLAAGRRVGITATSHKVIGNMLRAVLAAAAEDGVEVRAVQKGTSEQVLVDDRVTGTTEAAKVRRHLDDGAMLAAGTSWLWVSPHMEGAVDVLFVDEAGQVSLADVVAMAAAADSFVLLGDPQQLDQPLTGTHPPGAERSALAHVLAGVPTIPGDRGLFLETTWRLHPEVCRFTSEAFYEGRLVAEPHLVDQRMDAAPPGDGVGLRLIEVATEGFDSESPPEAERVAAIASAIVDGGTWTDQHGREHPVGWEDVLIVAPYNAQVGAIRRLVPPEARVGTVDRFQGQEAPISIYSMTTSTPAEAPRGMSFLYSRNRLNVATSRARCVAVVVASPALLHVHARTPEQLRLANALCRFAELAAAPAPAATGPLTLGL